MKLSKVKVEVPNNSEANVIQDWNELTCENVARMIEGVPYNGISFNHFDDGKRKTLLRKVVLNIDNEAIETGFAKCRKCETLFKGYGGYRSRHAQHCKKNGNGGNTRNIKHAKTHLKKIFAYIFLSILLFFLWRNSSQKNVRTLLEKMHLDCEKPDEKFEFNGKIIEEVIRNSDDKCGDIQDLFDFHKNNLSEEEKDYPLAYGILTYKDVTQLLFMLSAIYQPQNVFCIAYPENANMDFIKLLNEIKSCWSNVYIFERPQVEWGGFEIINSVYFCLDFLTNLKNDWRYYQYLSGVDVPLKTNLEMVRIFKAMNDSPNFEVTNYQEERFMTKNRSVPPLPIYKSSLSCLIPRKTAKFIISSGMPQKLLDFINGTYIPDEAFWGTLLGNRDSFNVPGSINASEFIKHKISKNWDLKYYISRYQIWDSSKCGGYFASGSCVFSVKDLGTLRRMIHLIAHKFYLDYQPAAYFCLLREHRNRTIHPNANFSTSSYEELPQVELLNGKNYDNLTHPDWL